VAELLTEVPQRVLAVYAHPDDPDVAAGGTLAGWAAAGCSVHVCICAQGDKGSADPKVDTRKLAQRRREEAKSAGGVLGVEEHHWLGYPDGELGGAPRLVEDIVALVRSVSPDAVVAPDPTAVFFGQHYVNHPDHRAVGWATIDAVAPAAANPHYFPRAGSAHRVGCIYLSGTLEPDVWVDISWTIETKVTALACHTSQLGESAEWLRQAVRQRAEEAGRQAQVGFAEAFRRIVL
jgi:LmbE family N-acetylglucosaminyl deacetylase